MWKKLSHNGVLFPPEYEPHGVKMLYDGKPVDLTPEQEVRMDGTHASGRSLTIVSLHALFAWAAPHCVFCT